MPPVVTPDRCPYPRPFAADFAGCPAFQPMQFEPLDVFGNPLAPVWTCRNLVGGALGAGHFYPRCRIGDPEARRQWAERFGERAARLREIRTALAEAVRPTVDRFLEVQRAQLEQPSLRLELARAAQVLIAELGKWVESHGAELRAMDFEPETARAILRDMVMEWTRSRIPITTLAAPPELIGRYPEMKALLAPEPEDA